MPPKVFEWDVAAQKLTIRSSSGIFPRRGGVSNVTEIYDNDPNSAKLEYRINWGFKIADLDVDTHTVVRMSLTKEDFLLTGEVKGIDDAGKEVFSKVWDRKIPRKLL